MKRGYYIHGGDEVYGVAVVANSLREAKKKAFIFLDEDEWIEMKGRWIRDANVIGLEEGIIHDLYDGLRRGFYSYIEGNCEACGEESHLSLCSDKALCFDCAEKEYEREEKKNE